MKIKHLFLVVAFISLNSSFGFGPGEIYGKGIDRDDDHMQRNKIIVQLDLSDKQKQQMKEYLDERKEERMKTMIQMKKMHHKLRLELSEKDIDYAKVENVKKEILSAQAHRLNNEIKDILEHRKIFTEEQIGKLHEIQSKQDPEKMDWGRREEKAERKGRDR